MKEKPPERNLLSWPYRVAMARIVVHLTIEGEPLSKQRARFSVSKNGHVYTPRQTKECEEWIGWQIKDAYRQLVCNDTHSFGVRVLFHQSNYQRRDIDNMTKLLFDASTGLVWKDDSQVTELVARVIRGDEKPRTEVCIYTTDYLNFPAAKCVVCGKAFRVYPSWKGRDYCSRKCRLAAMPSGRGCKCIITTRTGKVVECAHCGKLIYRAAWKLKIGGAQFCSVACKKMHTTVDVTCAHCGKVERIPQSWARRGRHYCSLVCKEAFFRTQRAKHSQGTCDHCGGTTSKKQYRACMACVLQARIEKGKAEIDPKRGPATIVEVSGEA